MYTKFEALPEEKQSRVVNSALDEFSRKAYDTASTDEIAKNAGVSKGALFSYFGSKKQLYLYVYRYSFDIVSNELWSGFDFACGDLFERIRSSISAKIRIFERYPSIFDFFLNIAAARTGSELEGELASELSSQTKNAYGRLMSGVDFSYFKEGFDVKQALNVIFWTFEGYGNRKSAEVKAKGAAAGPYSRWMAELEEYIKTLRQAFYKEEHLNGIRD